MKTMKRLCAAMLAAAILFTLSACHGKDEIALTVNDISIKSAMYLNALLEVDSEAKQRVNDEQNTDDTTASTDIDYFSQTIDGKKFVDYVKDQTIQRCKEYAFYQEMIDNGTLSLTDEQKAEAETYANIYWNYYGLSTTYEANGVSFDTYKQAFLYGYYSNAYFQSLYGEGGEQAVDKETIAETLTEKYALVYSLSATFDDKTTDAAKAEAKSQLEDYKKRLEKGESFETIYKEHNDVTESDDKEAASTSEDGPKDQYARVIGDEDTSNASDDFQTVFDMKKGEVKVIEAKDGTSATLYVKLDITEDSYYLTNLTDSILRILKGEEFEKLIDEKIADYTVDENTFATRRFKIKKLVYPS